MSITRGKRLTWGGHIDMSTHQLQRIYDRLRKRSLRQSEFYDETCRRASLGTITSTEQDAAFAERIEFYNMKGQRIDVAHQAYVRGVRDALQAVEEG